MDNLNELKIGLTAALWAAFGLIGWQGVLVCAWILLMLADYVSGTWAAKRMGNWSSQAARDGVMHKGGMVLVVAAAGLTDLVIWAVWDKIGFGGDWPFLVVVLILAWYCLTEVGSIIENAGKMGAPVPEWFAATLDAGLRIVDTKGEEIADKIAENKRNEEGIEND